MSEDAKPTHKISLCLGSSCFVRGNEQNLETVENFLKERNLEAQIELRGARCSENCAKGPRVEIDGEVYLDATPDKMLDILKSRFGQ
ncbi:MAG: NAD(P)H-dependent oxidoreductase subunit E [Thermoguttaceae bacterium]|jgi:NADH:ubiquinone oxidoreductase subunit E|nr:NAD(P)H-dependent oxidoreductase subunit E [Thermoguttaceae bacterium]MBR4750377.1 NAD(P)H-dependent oxidoreductase subunit E [Thermoguttaceae bacterium]MBR5757462.1 NAD(P)H-dependent oxidoreductase subunit E [Thermoguttaceae bacterium]